MEVAVTIIVILFAVMFVAGLVSAYFAFRFNKKKQRPVLTILLSVLLCPMIYIPLTYTLGFGARLSVVFVLVYSIAMIIWAIKNKNSNAE